MGAFTKRWIIRKRRSRRVKLEKLRKQYAAARSDADRNSVIAKALQVSPQMSTQEFLAPLQQTAKAS